VLGVDVGPSEDGAFWLRFLRAIVARGLAGVQLVVSAAQGLKGANRRGAAGGELATLPDSFHEERAVGGEWG